MIDSRLTRRGGMRSSGFDLKGARTPPYIFHKIFAGLLTADLQCRRRRSIPRLAQKLFRVLDERLCRDRVGRLAPP